MFFSINFFFFLLGFFSYDAKTVNIFNCSKNNSVNRNFLSAYNKIKLCLLELDLQLHPCSFSSFPQLYRTNVNNMNFLCSESKTVFLFCRCKNNYLFLLLNTLPSMAMQYPQMRERRNDVKWNNHIPATYC